MKMFTNKSATGPGDKKPKQQASVTAIQKESDRRFKSKQTSISESSRSGSGEEPKAAKGERFRGQGAVVTRDVKGTLQAKRGDDYVGAGTTKESAAGDRLRASTSDAGKRGNYQSGTAPMMGGSYKPTYTGPKGKVSYIQSSIVKKKNLKPMS